MVIGPKNHGELAAAMAPFQENNMGDCQEQFLAFVEDEDCDLDEKAGRRGYWENPNAKWDWYQLGGRWAGFLLVSAGVAGIRSEESTFSKNFRLRRGEPDPYGDDPLRVDAARHGDINWEGMMKAMAQAAGKRWDEEMQRVAQADKTAEAWRSEFFSMDDKTKGRFARMLESTGLPNSLETYRLWCLNRSFLTGVDLLHDKDRGGYVAKNSVPLTFAYLKDGKWGERGDMGWFGCVADEKDCTTWEKEFEQMLETLSPDTMIWIVDCHI
ncbi:hypothetical protein JCM15519_17170 [Fundidesulfovibrio butyratiphilus]